MSDLALIIGAHMRALVARLGCLDAVAATIDARWGDSTSKGTLSRKCSGSLEWTIKDAVALEDATGSFPITRLLEQRRSAAMSEGRNVCSLTQIADISRETGEAVAKVLAAQASNNAGDRAEAVKEIDEALAALLAVRDRLSGAPV